MGITFGVPKEQEAFLARSERFMEVYPQLVARIDEILALREFKSADTAQRVVFFLGRLVAEDFMEIFLNSANGYGMAGLKLLRPMFEAVVTALYIARHPEDAEAFLEYHVIHQRKMLKIAEATGIDVSDAVSKDEQPAIEVQYQAIKDRYRQMTCPECGAVLSDTSWTKKDPIAMSRELGLQESSFGLYSYTTLHIHTTPTRLTARLEQTPDGGIRFKVGPQHAEADAALVGAHVCIGLILDGHNRYFGLGIEGLEKELIEGIRHAWPDRPEAQNFRAGAAPESG